MGFSWEQILPYYSRQKCRFIRKYADLNVEISDNFLMIFFFFMVSLLTFMLHVLYTKNHVR